MLGHGKKKLGIQRDRVPFVLTEHFLFVIRQGRPIEKESHEVKKFERLCSDAFVVLHENRHLICSFFSIAQAMGESPLGGHESSGLPELRVRSDLDHVRGTLAVVLQSTDEARGHFDAVFEEAFNGSWATKTNWFFHAVKHM